MVPRRNAGTCFGTGLTSRMVAGYLASGNDTWAPSGATFAGNELLVAALAARGFYAFDAAAGTLKPVLRKLSQSVHARER